MGIITKLWNGDYSLAKTFWLFDLLIGMIAGFALLLLLMFCQCTLNVMTAIYSVMLCYAVLVNVGLWRAADKYSGKLVWAKLVKAYVVFCFATMILQYAKLSCVDLLMHIYHYKALY